LGKCTVGLLIKLINFTCLYKTGTKYVMVTDRMVKIVMKAISH